MQIPLVSLGKLDRLARSMKQLIEIIEKLLMKSIGFCSLTEAWSAPKRGLAVARRIVRTRGRLPKLTDDDIGAAKAMLTNSDIGVTQIARGSASQAADLG